MSIASTDVKLLKSQRLIVSDVPGTTRDSVELSQLPIGIRALHSHPLKSHKRGNGDRDKLISFAGINFRSDYHVYVDEDGIVVCEQPLV